MRGGELSDGMLDDSCKMSGVREGLPGANRSLTLTHGILLDD